MRFSPSIFSLAAILMAMTGYGDIVRIGVSVLPLETLLKEIGGDYVEVHSLQQEGDNCSVFEPRPSSVTWLAGADLFFRTGVGYESIILGKLERQHSQLRILDLRHALEASSLRHSDHDHGHGEEEHTDPHLWMDPVNLADLGEWIAHQLIEVQPDQAAYFEKRAKDFRTRMMKLDGEIAEMLKPYSGRAFFIYHPALSYFAGRYGLHQEAIEESGHAPSIGELHRLIKRARDEGIRTIFVQPQESLHHAEVVSQAIGGSIEEIDPMALDLEANLLKISQVLVESFSPQ